MNIKVKYGCYVKGRFIELNEEFNVSKSYFASLKDLLKIRKVKKYPLVRVGIGNKDGSYIMLNNFKRRGIAYSFGICDDVSWDNVMAELGYNIYMYDHTIEKLPYERQEFHFFKEGIAGTDFEDMPLKTLDYYLKVNRHTHYNNMILKMDVEGAEWDFLNSVSSDILNQFDQIVFEFHNVIRKDCEKYLPLLNKLNETHQLVHLHGNNMGLSIQVGNTTFCDVLEASYVRKDNYDFEDNYDINLPIELDYPNNTTKADIILGKWNEPFIE